jgi:hemolysin activation/secretion protein
MAALDTARTMNIVDPKGLRAASGLGCGLLLGALVHATPVGQAAIAAQPSPVAAAADLAPPPPPVRPQPPAPLQVDVSLVEVAGNTVLPPALIEKVMAPFAGPGKTLQDLEKARATLEETYQRAGYITVVVDLDPVAHEQGVLRLNVLEGKLARLKVSGSQYLSPDYVRTRVPALKEGEVPNFNDVQQQLMGVSRGDARRVQPIMRPGRTPGTVETELKVSDELPLSFNLELNNRQAPETRPMRMVATVRYDNLFQADHSASLVYITAPQEPKQVKVGVLSYTLPSSTGGTWALYAVRSNSRTTPIGAATVFGSGSVLGVRHVWPMPGLEGLNHSISVGVDRKAFRERIGSDDSSPTTPLVYLPFSLAYNGSHERERRNDTVSATVTAASRDLLARQVDCPGYDAPMDQFACKNPHADGSFAHLRLDWRHRESLWERWQGLWRVGGQLSSQPLVSNEQFALGGVDTVRGYLDSEVTGDRAWLASLALQTPNLVSAKDGWFSEVRVQAFRDQARAHVSQPQPGVPPVKSLASYGLALNFTQGKHLSGDMSVAWPLKEVSSYSQRHHPRLQARFVAQF